MIRVVAMPLQARLDYGVTAAEHSLTDARRLQYFANPTKHRSLFSWSKDL